MCYEDIENLLRHILNAPASKSYQYTISTLFEVAKHPDDIINLRGVYVQVGNSAGSTPCAVEKGVERYLKKCWSCGNRKLLSALTCSDGPVYGKQLLYIMAAYLKRHTSDN